MKYSQILLSLTILLVIISAAFIAAKDVKKGGDSHRRGRSDKEPQSSKPGSKITDVGRSDESEDSSKVSNWGGKPTNNTRPHKPSKSPDDSSSKYSSDDKKSDHGKKSRDSDRRRHSKSSSSSSSSSSDSDSHRSHADLIISKDFCKGKKDGYYCVPGNALDRVQCPGNKLKACGSGSFCATIGYRGLDYSCEKPFDPVAYCKVRGNGLHCAPNNTGSTGVWSCPSGKEVQPCPASAHCKEYSQNFAICASNVRSSSDSDSSSTSSSTSESSHHHRRDSKKPRQLEKEESESESSSSDSGYGAVKAYPVRRKLEATGTSRPATATEEEKSQKSPAVKESSESSAQVANDVDFEPPKPDVDLAPVLEPVPEPVAELVLNQEIVDDVSEEPANPEVEQLQTPAEKSTKRDAHAQKPDDKKGKASVKQAGNVVAVYDVAAITSIGLGAVYITTTEAGLRSDGVLTTATGVYSIILGSPPDQPFLSYFVTTTVIDCVEMYSIFSVPLCSTLTSIDNCNVTGSIILCPPTQTSLISCCGAPTTSTTIITEAVFNIATTPTILISPFLSGVFTSTATSAILIAPTISTTVTIGTISTADEITDECTRTFSFTSLSSILVSATETFGSALFSTGTNLLTLDCLASIVVVPTDPINGTISFEICAQLTPATVCESFIFNNIGQSLCVQLGGGVPIGLNQVLIANVDAPNGENNEPVIKSSGNSRRLARAEQKKEKESEVTVNGNTKPLKRSKRK